MSYLMILLFVVGYIIIVLEHPLKINKSATALVLGVLLWVFAMLGGEGILVDTSSLRDFIISNPGSKFSDWLVHSQLLRVMGEVSEILFFLLGAMTIVELVDTQGGFNLITDKIRTTKKVKLLWITSILAFSMSAVLDNLTTSIVMVALLRKLIADKKDRWFYASMVIIAANSGGAWSPIGDVTTVMLWVANKVSALNIIKMTFLASFTSFLVPLTILSFMLKGNVERPQLSSDDINDTPTKEWQSILFLCMGVGALLFVPIFKTITHLPPYLGVLGGLGVLWITSEIIHRNANKEEKEKYTITTILTKIDASSVLFFLGILVAVNALTTVGHLGLLANKLETINLPEPEKYYLINIFIGMLSAIVDNVPLVAGAMSMYSFPTDHYFWEFLSYSAGAGGSILIIGSAAGVAVMGIEKIDFTWYLKNVSWIVLVAYFAGAAVFIGQKELCAYFFGDTTGRQTEVVLTEEGIKDYLLKNSFYIVNVDEENNAKDSTSLQFHNYNEYYGLSVNSIQTMNDSVFVYDTKSISLLSDYMVNNDVVDTIVEVLFGDQHLLITKSGEVYLIIESNFIPLKRIK